MKIKVTYFFILSLLFFCACKNKSHEIVLTGNISDDIKALLSPGENKIEIMDSIVQTTREIELSNRMQKAVEANAAWYQDWSTHYRQLRVLPYHANFGLSQSEYEELMDMKMHKNIVSSYTGAIMIRQSDNNIEFGTGDKLVYLDNLKFNTGDNSVLLDGYPLHFTDTIFVDHEDHGLKSKWKGYVWRYNEPDDNDTLNDRLNTKHYSITLGQLYKTGNTLLIISKLEDVDGERKVNFEKILIIKP